MPGDTDPDNEEASDEALALLFRSARPKNDDLVERVITGQVMRGLFGDGSRKPAANNDGGETADDPRDMPSLGRLTLLSPIGTGAMGSVLEAHDPVLDRRVAVKIVHEATPKSRARATAEARHLAKLNHPGVVGVYDVGELDDGSLYLVMEHVAGQNLREWSSETRSQSEVAAILRAAGVGLAAAHSAGIVHRDIKPENILVGDDGSVKLADFGVAQTGGDLARLAGTEGYLAPELLQGHAATEQSDQYAFCVTLRETLSRSGATESIHLRALIERGLLADPAARFGSMSALVEAFDAKRSAPASKSIRSWFAFGAIACVGLAALAYLLRADPPESTSSPCESGALQNATPWPAAARAELHDRLQAVTGFGAESLHQLMDRLDTNAGEWSRARVAVCDGVLAQEVLHARASCLVHERDQIQAWGRAAARLDDVAQFSRVAGALERVSNPQRCATLERDQDGRLRTSPESPALQDAYALLAEAEISLALGQYPAASSMVHSLLESADSTQDPAFVARLAYVAGRIAARQGQPEEAATHFERAMENAALAGAARLEANIWLGVVRNEVLSGSPERALEWSSFATTALRRANLSTKELAGMEGEAYAALGRYEDAAERLHFALAEPEAGGERLAPVRRAIAEMNLGRISLAQDRPEDALEHFDTALHEAAAALGEEHPGRAMYIDQRGRARLAGGDVEGAIADHQRAIDIRRAAYGENDRAVASSYLRLVEAHVEALRPDEAEAHLRSAVLVRTEVFGPERATDAAVEWLRGDIAMLREDFSIAAEHYRASVEQTSADHLDRMRDAWAKRGLAALATHDAQEAERVLQAARADVRRLDDSSSVARCALWSIALRLGLGTPSADLLQQALCVGEGAHTQIQLAEARAALGRSFTAPSPARLTPLWTRRLEALQE